MGWIGIIGSVVVLYDAWLALRDSNRWWWSRVQIFAIAVSCVGFAWFLYHWHILHFNLKY